MIEAQQTHSLSDFIKDPKTHVARIKQTHTPEVLTINGRAEVVLLDTETYENLMEQLQNSKTIASLRMHMAKAQKNAVAREPVTEEDIQHSQAIMLELVEETERLGLYR
jgi:PHD/YefM family antitoxin component YafN of YafNO toxin-antitoxin module